MTEKTLTPEDLDRLEELAKAAREAGVPLCDPNEPNAGEVFDFLRVDGLPAFEDDLPGLILSLVSMARHAPRWTPVEEGLPEESERVLVWVPGKKSYVRIAHWSIFVTDDDREWILDRGGDMRRTPGFWMPLPEPPEGKG